MKAHNTDLRILLLQEGHQLRLAHLGTDVRAEAFEDTSVCGTCIGRDEHGVIGGFVRDEGAEGYQCAEDVDLLERKGIMMVSPELLDVLLGRCARLTNPRHHSLSSAVVAGATTGRYPTFATTRNYRSQYEPAHCVSETQHMPFGLIMPTYQHQ
jgi:hypothetical protein